METQVKITEKEGWVRVLEVEVPSTVVDETFATVTQGYKKQAEIPGFRQGKAPIEMVRARYGSQIRQETLEQLLPGAYEHAVKENKLTPLGDPAISDVVFEKNQPFTFKVEITVRPEVEITDYKGLNLKRQVYEVTDEDVDRTIDQFREVKAEQIDVTRPVQTGDVVVCDLQKISDKFNRLKTEKFTDQVIDLAEDRCAPEFFKDLPQMKIGEGKEIEVTYPPNHPQPDFAGNTVRYRAWVKSIREKKLPAVDDEFAKSLGPFEGLDDLRGKVRLDLERKVQQDSRKDLTEQVRKAVVENNKFEVPPALIDEYLQSVVDRLKTFGSPDGQPLDEEKVRAEFQPMAEEQFRWDFIMHEVAKAENISVSSDELAAIRKVFEESRRQSDTGKQEPMDDEKVRAELLEQKVLDFLIDNAETEDEQRTLTSRIVKP